MLIKLNIVFDINFLLNSNWKIFLDSTRKEADGGVCYQSLTEKRNARANNLKFGEIYVDISVDTFMRTSYISSHYSYQ